MAPINTGAPAPDFTLDADNGKPFTLSHHLGKPVAIYFYAEDDSGGCVIENQEFSELSGAFAKAGVTLVGISPDTIKKHLTFKAKYGLKPLLLADPEHSVIDAYGLWDHKKMFGHEFMGVIRGSYLIDSSGKIAGYYRASRIKGHAQTLLNAARALTASQ